MAVRLNSQPRSPSARKTVASLQRRWQSAKKTAVSDFAKQATWSSPWSQAASPGSSGNQAEREQLNRVAPCLRISALSW